MWLAFGIQGVAGLVGSLVNNNNQNKKEKHIGILISGQ